jgi:hypothetical protein
MGQLDPFVVCVKTRLQSVFLLARLKRLIHDYIENLPDKGLDLAFPSGLAGQRAYDLCCQCRVNE